MNREPFDAARALRWLRQLERHNDRIWFAAHRATYDEHVRPEWEDLVAVLLLSAVRYDARFAHVDPRRCLFRLARDIRFSADKTPFKTHLSAWLSPFGKSGANAGYYVSVAPGESHFSAGIYTPERPVLLALRRRLAADPRPFDRLLRAKAMQRYLPLKTDGLIRTPREFPRDHSRAELLRARNYLVGRTYTDAEITRAGALAAFRSAMHACAPFVRYLDGVAASVSSVAMREPIDGWDENSSSDHFGGSSSAKF